MSQHLLPLYNYFKNTCMCSTAVSWLEGTLWETSKLLFFFPVPCLDSEDMTAMAALPFLKADIREIFESKFCAVSG